MSHISSLLPSFNINSAGPLSDDLWLRQVEAFVHGIKALTDGLGESHGPTYEDVHDAKYRNDDAVVLGELLNAHGSDKNSTHVYHTFYSTIMKPVMSITILEIGLGTNNTDVPSNMGAAGRPGASLRAFRDYLPLARVFGADIDHRVLFSEDRIATTVVDQLSAPSLASLPARLGVTGFDIIIDDGLHAIGANINVIAHMLPVVNPGGYLVIEDINLNNGRDGWLAIDAILMATKKYDTKFIRGQTGVYLYVVHVVGVA